MYYQPSTQKEFATHSEVRAAFPQTSMPTDLTDEILLTFGVYSLTKNPPTHDPITHYAREIAPKLINGHYEQDYEVVALDAATVAANRAKAIETLIASITNATQAHLDTFAKTRNYDSIMSACTYATSAIPQFASEAQYCVSARDRTWATLYTIMAEVQAGTRPMPASFADVELALPVLAWPA